MLPPGRRDRQTAIRGVTHSQPAARTPHVCGSYQGVMRTLLALIAGLLCLAPVAQAAADTLVLVPPVPAAVVRGFDHVGRYAAGHRGVDLEADAGQLVRASAPGRVSFSGSVAGVMVVSIDHGNGWRTTYLPVAARVAAGDEVRLGDAIGTLLAGHCERQACLHWGLTDGLDHADPLSYTQEPRVRLVPEGTAPKPPPDIGAARVAPTPGRMPVVGRPSSAFGMRRHPITGVWKLHDGSDIAAPCSTPIVSPYAGTVTRAYYHAAYGWRVFIDHAGGLTTAYNHLPSLSVRVGQPVDAGQRIGTIGNTGLSTGCHLHWMAWRHGRLIDPMGTVG